MPPTGANWEIWAIITVIVAALSSYGTITVARIQRERAGTAAVTNISMDALRLAISTAIISHADSCVGIRAINASIGNICDELHDLATELRAQAGRVDALLLALYKKEP